MTDPTNKRVAIWIPLPTWTSVIRRAEVSKKGSAKAFPATSKSNDKLVLKAAKRPKSAECRYQTTRSEVRNKGQARTWTRVERTSSAHRRLRRVLWSKSDHTNTRIGMVKQVIAANLADADRIPNLRASSVAPDVDGNRTGPKGSKSAKTERGVFLLLPVIGKETLMIVLCSLAACL